MKHQEKLNACRNQFLYPLFLEDHRDLLTKLHENKTFMKNIREVSENTAEELLFGCGIQQNAEKAARFQNYKDSFCNIFFDNLKFADYPEYQTIYHNIKASGYSGKSATISVFYAMVFFDILDEMQKPKQQKVGLLKRLFSGIPDKINTVEKTCYRSDASLRKEFEAYLIKCGYKQYTPSGNPSTVPQYIKSIDYVCDIEHLDWNGLAENIRHMIPQYDQGGSKEQHGNKSHRTVINALFRYAEFLYR